jgi:hypothetical protein
MRMKTTRKWLKERGETPLLPVTFDDLESLMGELMEGGELSVRGEKIVDLLNMNEVKNFVG